MNQLIILMINRVRTARNRSNLFISLLTEVLILPWQQQKILTVTSRIILKTLKKISPVYFYRESVLSLTEDIMPFGLLFPDENLQGWFSLTTES